MSVKSNLRQLKSTCSTCQENYRIKDSRRLTEVIKAEDAVAIDVVYVNRCWANGTSKVCPRQEKDDSINHTLSEIEDKNFEKKKERKKEKRKKKRKERKKERESGT